MSELKARTARSIADEEEMLELGADCPIEQTQVYLKSEADKVIAEKDKEIAELEERIADGDKDFEMANHQNEWLLKIVRHQKYKRCLAMARWCEERYNYLTCLENWQMTDKEYQQVIGDYWDRWHKRWLMIAEQFKDKEA